MAIALTGTLYAGVVATDDAIPAAMNATGGTVSDPMRYVYGVTDNYSKDWGSTSLTVGNASGSEWVRLEVRNGAQVTTAGTLNRIGGDSSSYISGHNTVLVTGSGSSLSLGTTRIGGMSDNNALVVEDGAVVSFTGEVFSGYNNTPASTNNTIIVDNGTLSLGARLRIGYGDGHNYDSLVVRNGGVLTTTTGRIGVRYGKYCDFAVQGAGSTLTISYASGAAITLGEGTTYPHHNTLTISDGGLVKLTQTGGTLTIAAVPAEGGSGVRFAAGVLAVAGNRTTLVTYDKAWLWDGNSWEQAPNDWTGTYYADETAAAAAGFSGLGGYTVFTGGKSLTGGDKATLVVIR